MRCLRSLVLLAAAAGLACGPSPAPPPPAAPVPAPTAAAPTAAAAHSPQLRLDAGKRWKANPDTLAGVARMKDIVRGVDPASAPDVATFRDLGTRLQSELDTVITKCTMTGEAHEQLHAFLIPLMGHVARLREGSLDEARDALRGVSASLSEFDTYFE